MRMQKLQCFGARTFQAPVSLTGYANGTIIITITITITIIVIIGIVIAHISYFY